MLNVMLVDPERITRKRLRDHINSNKLGYKVIKEVENGKQALDELEKGGIDLVIAELRLPYVSGYHLFKKITFSYPNVKVILYLGLDELESIQKAVSEGLMECLVKPVKLPDLDRALVRAKQVFESIIRRKEDQNQISNKYESMRPLFQDRFLINLLHGHLENEKDIQGSFRYFNLNISPSYTVLLLKVDHYNKLSLVFDEREKDIFIFSLLTKVQETLNKVDNTFRSQKLQECAYVAFINNYDEIAVILGGKMGMEEHLHIADELRHTVRQETVTTVTIGIGRSYENASNLFVSYKQAKAAIRYSYILGTNSAIHIDFAEPENHITYRYPFKKEQLLVYLSILGNFAQVEKLLDELRLSLKNVKKLPQDLPPKIILDILVSVSRYSSERGISLEDQFKQHVSVKEIVKKANLDEAFDYLKNVLCRICEHIEKFRREIDIKTIGNAKEYIGTNDIKNMDTSKAAIALSTTPEYLDRIFRQQEGVTFADYVLRLKLDNAKELLLENALSYDEIAEKLGFFDIKHLQNVFLHHEGINIYDYKDFNKLNHKK